MLCARMVINRILLLAILGLGNDRFGRICQDTCATTIFETEVDGLPRCR